MPDPIDDESSNDYLPKAVPNSQVNILSRRKPFTGTSTIFLYGALGVTIPFTTNQTLPPPSVGFTAVWARVGGSVLRFGFECYGLWELGFLFDLSLSSFSFSFCDWKRGFSTNLRRGIAGADDPLHNPKFVYDNASESLMIALPAGSESLIIIVLE